MSDLVKMVKKEIAPGVFISLDQVPPQLASNVMLGTHGGVPVLYFGYFHLFVDDDAKRKVAESDAGFALSVEELNVIAKIALTPTAVAALKTALDTLPMPDLP